MPHWQVRVGILGPLQVVAGGEPVEVGGARLRALLVRLALDAGRTVSTEALLSALWPERVRSANTLQTLVSRLRRVLPGTDLVRSTPGGYRLAVEPEAVDAIRFERLAGDGRRALRDGDPATAHQLLAEALALWRGEALAGVADAPDLAAAVARLTELRLAATEDRIAAELAGGSPPAQLVAELQALAVAHPVRERPRTLLVRALHAEGRYGEALAAYESFRRRLADQLGADPGPELRDAHLAVLRAEPPEPPAPERRLAGNLRAELTSFVGRAEERKVIAGQLADGRLVTLVGPGGSGKTRLAATVAADLAGAIAGGAWLVELAPVTDPAEVPQAVIDALGLREGVREPVSREVWTGPSDQPSGSARAAERDRIARLVEALSATETLLVLDNCEHLLDPVARLADQLLGRCPPLRILATSREPLGLVGEALSPVPPLPVPDRSASVPEALASPAVRLFADRAAAVRPGFAVTGENAAPVAEICRRLDGLPLAIELAAARLRSLPVEEIAARIDERFPLLTGGSRTALPRHQTLRAAVAWSWDLLAPAERTVADRLAVFPGTITPAAAGHVCPAVPAVPDVLAALVDKSLLQLQDGAEPAYRMLETVREYGWERLAAAGELAAARAAHTAYYLELAERAAPYLRGAGQLPWIARLRADQGSTAAFGFAHDTGDTGTLVRLAAALSHFWTLQGDHAAAARRLRTALAAPGDAPGPARTVATAAYLLNTLLTGGDPSEALAFCRRRRDWEHGQPTGGLVEAVFAFAEQDTAAGLAATDPYLSDPDPWVRGVLWLVRSWLHGNDGDMGRLRSALDAAVGKFREAGERWGLATALTHRAHSQITLGAFDDAVAALVEAIALLRELDPADQAVQQRVLLAGARAQQGDRDRARAELQELVSPAFGTAPASFLVLARIALGDLARLDGDLAGAGREYDAAGQQLARMAFDASLLRAMLLCARGHLAVLSDALEIARQQLAEAFARAVEVPDLPVAADVAVAVVRLCSRWGRAEIAAELLGAAHALRGSPDASDPDVAELDRELRAELGERALRAAYGRGRGLDRAAAVGLVQAQLAGV